jgi:hypothetical protein
MLHDKLLAEYETISDTDFWKLLLSEIKKKRDRYSTNCETKEDNRRDQGAVAAIDEIIGRDYFPGCGKHPNIVVRLLEDAGGKSVK